MRNAPRVVGVWGHTRSIPPRGGNPREGTGNYMIMKCFWARRIHTERVERKDNSPLLTENLIGRCECAGEKERRSPSSRRCKSITKCVSWYLISIIVCELAVSPSYLIRRTFTFASAAKRERERRESAMMSCSSRHCPSRCLSIAKAPCNTLPRLLRLVEIGCDAFFDFILDSCRSTRIVHFDLD